jgi:hypothetical protein
MTAHLAPVSPRSVALLVLAVALGCTAAHRSARAPIEVLPDGSQIVCQMERPTGTNIAQEVCRRSYPASLARTRLQNELIEPKAQTAKP